MAGGGGGARVASGGLPGQRSFAGPMLVARLAFTSALGFILARYLLRPPYTLARWSPAGRRLLLSLLAPEVRGTHAMAGQDPGQPPPPSALLREMSYHYQRPSCFNDRRLASTSQNHQLLEYGPSPSVLATPLPCLTHTPPCKPTCQDGRRGSLQDSPGDSFILIRPYLYYPM